MSMSRIPDATMDMQGNVVFEGITMTLEDYYLALDAWIEEHVEALKDLRDPESDIQNLWGHKSDAFVDDIYGRTARIRRPSGYPSEIGDTDWQP